MYSTLSDALSPCPCCGSTNTVNVVFHYSRHPDEYERACASCHYRASSEDPARLDECWRAPSLLRILRTVPSRKLIEGTICLALLVAAIFLWAKALGLRQDDLISRDTMIWVSLLAGTASGIAQSELVSLTHALWVRRIRRQKHGRKNLPPNH